MRTKGALVTELSIKGFIDSSTRFLARLGKNRKVAPTGRPVKVNLGSGLIVADGWLNVDLSLNAFFSKWPASMLRRLYRFTLSSEHFTGQEYIAIIKGNTFIHHDLTCGVPFPDDSIDYAYTSHLLEHFYREDGEKFLRDIHRSLKKGGMLRVCVPDLDIALSLFRDGRTEQALALFFINPAFGERNRHLYMYDFELLKSILARIGFSEIEKCAFKRGKTPDIEILDSKPDETLYVEAVK
jgi:SAM-dependent methyltransferase